MGIKRHSVSAKASPRQVRLRVALLGSCYAETGCKRWTEDGAHSCPALVVLWSCRWCFLFRCSSTQCSAYRGMHKADARRNHTSQASSRYERSPNLRIKIRTEYMHAKSNPRQAARKHPRVLCHAASITLTAEATPPSKSTLH